jgi:D-glycero-D-manno-heptose 1,7-bisphosphate phosphatase
MDHKAPALFLDRDGTIIEEVNYLKDPDQVRLLPGVARAIHRINQLCIPVIVVTNQAGVARGLFSLEDVDRVHAHLAAQLRSENAVIEAFYVCPHHPSAGIGPWRTQCDCRKPRPGLLLRAASERNLDLCRSVMVGDKLLDLQAGAAAGCDTLLVRTGYGRNFESDARAADVRLLGVADNLAAAINELVVTRFRDHATTRHPHGEGEA